MNNVIHQLPSTDKEIHINLIMDSLAPVKMIYLGSNDLDVKINPDLESEFKIKIPGAEFLEIFYTFGLDNVKSIVTNQDSILKKTKIKIPIHNIDNKSKADKNVIFFKYSDHIINENNALHIILTELPQLFEKQVVGSSLILQIFDILTQPTVDLLYYLSSFYETIYVYKPFATNNLSPSKFIILLNLKKVPKIPKMKLDKNSYIISLETNPSKDFMEKIQCANAYHHTELIKNYLNSKISNEIDSDQWTKMFDKKNDLLLKYLITNCDYSEQLISHYN